MVSLLAAKAEVVFGLQLVSRHRAARLAALLALGVAGLAASSQPSPERVSRVVLFVAATLAAVSASRLLSPGPAFAAGRMVVAPWWLVPVGRLVGAMCVVGPMTIGVALALAAASTQTAPLAGPVAVACGYAVCLAACVMGVTPYWGASGTAAVGFLGVLLGASPPSAIAMLFAGWGPFQHITIWLWNVLPLPWRAARWLATRGWADPLMLLVWTLIGLGLAALRLAGARPGPRQAGS